MRPLRLALIAAAALAAVAAVAFARAEPAQTAADTDPEGVTVIGAAGVEAIPDRAQLSLGVETRGATARDALNANSTTMRRVVAALREAGIAAADIRTESVSLSPRTNDNGERVSGYVASNIVVATIRDLDRAGAVIDAAVEAGANHVNGLSMLRADRTDLYKRALRAAYADARAKADTLAAASGSSIGRVLAMEEQVGGGVIFTAGAAEDRAATPIEPGSERIEAIVTVTFALQ